MSAYNLSLADLRMHMTIASEETEEIPPHDVMLNASKREETEKMKKFSIITICLNAENCIEDTIISVLNQTCIDFEYIVKDGNSKDRTVSIAQSFAPAFSARGIPFLVISQPDLGIYDAMNQATQRAQGNWILYMNAGDQIADQNVLNLIGKSSYLEIADILYGNHILQRDDYYFCSKPEPLETIRYKMPFCHQSTFTRRELLLKSPYSLKYRICSDYKFYLQMYLDGKRFEYIPIDISIYDADGISANYKLRYQEKIEILEEFPVRDEVSIQRLKNELEYYENYKKSRRFKNLLKGLVPPKLLAKRREWKRTESGWKTTEEFLLEKEKRNEMANRIL